jgi:hypothetical protein
MFVAVPMVVFEDILSVLPANRVLVTSEADGKEIFFIGWYSYVFFKMY